MNYLPQSEKINVRLLGQVFRNTTATYKFYWFLSILELFNTRGDTLLSYRDLICRMIGKAWFPIHFFRLSFGQADLLASQCHEIQELSNLRIDVKDDELQNELYTLYANNTEIHAHILNFGRNVPHWFMSPCFPHCSEKQIVELSQRFVNNCPYAIFRAPEKHIVINPAWSEYLSENYGILCDFCYWNLTMFLQRRNPNVPDIPHKLTPPLARASLTKQRKYWNVIFEQLGSFPCIYTGRPLAVGDFDLDHFIPRSFVVHDLMWNLIPADPSINSSKGNRLPSIDGHLLAFAKHQQEGLRIVSRVCPENDLLEDYLQLGATIPELTHMSLPTFANLYKKSIMPLYQIAENMGFARWVM